jgi:hypothetical protein
MRLYSPLLLLLPILAVAACSEEPPAGPPKSRVKVINESSTEAQVRIRMWQKDFTKVTSGKDAELEFESKGESFQIEAKSRKQWDECWISMQVGDTLVVFDDGERIGCKIKR